MTPDPLPLTRRAIASWPHLRDARHDRDEAHAVRVLGLTEREAEALRRLRANLAALPPRAEWIALAGGPVPAEIPAGLLAGLVAAEELAAPLAKAFAPPFLGAEEAFRRALAPFLQPAPPAAPTLRQQVAELLAEWEQDLAQPVYAETYARLCAATGSTRDSLRAVVTELRAARLDMLPLVAWTGEGEEEERRPMEMTVRTVEAPPPAPPQPPVEAKARPVRRGPTPRADSLRERIPALCREWGLDPLQPLAMRERERLAQALGSTAGSVAATIADLRREAGVTIAPIQSAVVRQREADGICMEERLAQVAALFAARLIPLSRMLGRPEREELAAALGISRDQLEYALKLLRARGGVKVERTGVNAVALGQNGHAPPENTRNTQTGGKNTQAPDHGAVLAAAEAVVEAVLAGGMAAMTEALRERLMALVREVLVAREGG